MNRRLSITLMTLVSIVAFGFSSATHAAKPVQLEEQVITSAPIVGPSNSCQLTNVSGRGINAVVTIYAFNHNSASEAKAVPIGGWAWISHTYGTDNDFAYCEITWTGLPDDFRASFCVYQSGTWAPYPNACLELH